MKRCVFRCLVVIPLVLLPACTSDDPETSLDTTTTSTSLATTTTTAAAPAPVPNVVGKDLQEAQDALQAAGFYNLISHDVTGQDRYQVLDRNWKVCDQKPAPGTPVPKDAPIDLGSVKDEEACRSAAR